MYVDIDKKKIDVQTFIFIGHAAMIGPWTMQGGCNCPREGGGEVTQLSWIKPMEPSPSGGGEVTQPHETLPEGGRGVLPGVTQTHKTAPGWGKGGNSYTVLVIGFKPIID